MLLIAQGSSFVLFSFGTCTYAIHPNISSVKFNVEGIFTYEDNFCRGVKKFKVLDDILFIRYTAVDMA
jgi:hypothetical protein